MLHQLTEILQLPESCQIDSKLTKAFFKRNFDLSVAERKLLDDSSTIIKMDIVASLKTANCNIPNYSDDQMQFIEVLVIAARTGEPDFDNNKYKVAELIQKYIPYPILLCIYSDSWMIMNTCDKRLNLNETEKRTVVKCYYTENISRTVPSEKQKAFLDSLIFTAVSKQNLKTLFDDYTNRIIALQSAELTGTFAIRNNERSKEDVQYLENIARLQSEILTLHNQAKKETQLSVQVKLNAAIQEKRIEIKKLENIITS